MTIETEGSHIMLFCTSPTKEVAATIADRLVQHKLAACVNIIEGLTSIYRWKGEICRDQECLMLIKSRGYLFNLIEKEIKAHHPYEIPEIISVPLLQGHVPYLRWIDESIQYESNTDII